MLAQPVPARCVVIFYPHTSNWDTAIGLCVKFMTGLPIRFAGKDTLFRVPLLGPLLVRWGGVPVNRRERTGFIEQMTARVRGATRIPPGDRARRHAQPHRALEVGLLPPCARGQRAAGARLHRLSRGARWASAPTSISPATGRPTWRAFARSTPASAAGIRRTRARSACATSLPAARLDASDADRNAGPRAAPRCDTRITIARSERARDAARAVDRAPPDGRLCRVEAVAGCLAGSLALISDAGHMVTDAASFVVALIAAAVAARPPSQRASYGYARAEVLAAFVNALAMLALIVWIAVEAVQRLLAPVPVAGPTVMVVAAAGLAVNLVVAWMLSRGASGINARGALLHVVGDLLGSVAALVAGAVIYRDRLDADRPDPVARGRAADPALDARAAQGVDRRAAGGRAGARVVRSVGRALAAMPGVTGVHDLHVWQMSAERVALSAHLTLADGAGLAARARVGAADARARFRDRSRDAAAGVAGAAAGRTGDTGRRAASRSRRRTTGERGSCATRVRSDW